MCPLHVFLVSTMKASLPGAPSCNAVSRPAASFLRRPHTATPKLRVSLNTWHYSLAEWTRETGRPQRVPQERLGDAAFPGAAGCAPAGGTECPRETGRSPLLGRLSGRRSPCRAGLSEWRGHQRTSGVESKARARWWQVRQGGHMGATFTLGEQGRRRAPGGLHRGQLGWVHSLNVMLSRFMHVVASISFPFSWLNNIPSSVCTYFIY